MAPSLAVKNEKITLNQSDYPSCLVLIYFSFRKTKLTPEELADDLDCPLVVFLHKSGLVSRVLVRFCLTEKNYTTNQVCVWRIIMLNDG